MTFGRKKKKTSRILRNPKIRHRESQSLGCDAKQCSRNFRQRGYHSAIHENSSSLQSDAFPQGVPRSDASNDHAVCIFKGSQILLGLIILECEDGTTLGNVGETPTDLASHPTRQYLHSQLRGNLLKSRIHYYLFFPQAATSTICAAPIN